MLKGQMWGRKSEEVWLEHPSTYEWVTYMGRRGGAERGAFKFRGIPLARLETTVSWECRAGQGPAWSCTVQGHSQERSVSPLMLMG